MKGGGRFRRRARLESGAAEETGSERARSSEAEQRELVCGCKMRSDPRGTAEQSGVSGRVTPDCRPDSDRADSRLATPSGQLCGRLSFGPGPILSFGVGADEEAEPGRVGWHATTVTAAPRCSEDSRAQRELASREVKHCEHRAQVRCDVLGHTPRWSNSASASSAAGVRERLQRA